MVGTAACFAACAHNVSAPPKPPPTAAAARPAVGRSPAAVPRRSPAVPAGRPARPATAPAAVPQILGASVSPSIIGSGTVVRAVVRTTPGVVSVVASAGGVSMAVPRVGPGVFEGSTTIPSLPPFARGSYAVTFIARDARGARTQTAVGVLVR